MEVLIGTDKIFLLNILCFKVSVFIYTKAFGEYFPSQQCFKPNFNRSKRFKFSAKGKFYALINHFLAQCKKKKVKCFFSGDETPVC